MTSEPLWTVEETNPPVGTDGRELTGRGARTRERLLQAAEEVFADLGYHDASIVKITEAARVAQGTFYRYFTSKEQIFEELVRDLNRRVRRSMSEHAGEASSRAERERLGFRGYFRFAAQHPGLYRIIRQAEIVAPHILREHYQKISRGYVAGLRDAMDGGDIERRDPEVLAWVLMGIGEIVGLRWILWDEDGQVPEHVFEEMDRFISAGLQRATGSRDAVPGRGEPR